ncbi:MAG: prepilin-type N-terminal cleavage/methylation domain-containing protein, partial [Nitrospira sp.]|nr:prepilin-type N-terminal cleavage/methylation domain-containing protein [Nitrospira sp.]
MEWHHDLTSSSDRRNGMVPDSRGTQLHRLRSCEGFSFIEVMIVVVILAILATLLIPRV